ncbi:MAG: hypothetical protein DRN88_00925 [Candidatus Hydrothermarchaeota archaeon]|nr:MAG: hypothetical protein DRN88_00925 [Candidatus Hydrothermarchaeota archaeon]
MAEGFLQKLKEPLDYRTGAILIAIVLVIMVIPYRAWAFAGGLRWIDSRIMALFLGMDFINNNPFWKDVYYRSPAVAVSLLFFILGGFVSAYISKEFGIKYDKDTIPDSIIGGLLMGIGIMFISTCNIGIFLNSVPQLSLGGIIAGIGLIVGTYIGAKIYERRMGL